MNLDAALTSSSASAGAWWLAVGLGLVYPLGLAPFDYFPITLVSMAGLFLLLWRQPQRAVGLAYVFGVGKYALGVSWIFVSVHYYGNTSAALAGMLVFGFVLFMALFCLPIGLFMRWAKPTSPQWPLWQAGLIFSASWLLMEWALTWFLTGFPWLYAGYALLDTPMQVVAPILGVFGVSLAALLTALGIAALLVQQSWRRRFAVLAFIGVGWAVAWLGAMHTWVAPGDRFTVALVQGNLDQAVKWHADKLSANVEKHIRLSEEHWDADVLIWPEAALTLYGGAAQQAVARLHARAQATMTNVVVGMPLVEVTPGSGAYQVYNSARGMGEASGSFAKHHLVPFGDYLPMQEWLRGLVNFFAIPQSAAARGSAEQANISLRLPGASSGQEITEMAMGICYEIAYGDSIRLRAADAGVLATISNDTWFGSSIGPHQHLQIARMRALENGRWMLRATNNGVTAIVDANGQVTAQLPQFQAGVLRGEFQVMHGATPFARWGNSPVLALVALLLVGALGRRAFGRHL